MTPALAKKISDLAAKFRRNGYTQPTSLEVTVPELRELDALAKASNGSSK